MVINLVEELWVFAMHVFKVLLNWPLVMLEIVFDGCPGRGGIQILG